MDTIRFQNLTPEVYTDESRDFQVLCRLYDSIFNGIKYDTDSIKYIVDSKNIQSGLLPLLQTKLGFLTKKSLSDTEIRYVLRVFPELLRNKGSLIAIKKLLNMCLKLNNISGEYTISYSDTDTVINGININSHTIIVGISSVIKSTELINEVARYILPAGFSFYIYFYKNYNSLDDILLNDDVKLLYSSSNLNSQIRGPINKQYEELSDTILGGVDTAWIDSIDSELTDSFKGYYSSVSQFPSGETDDVAITVETVNNIKYPVVYLYRNSTWNKLNFRGYCELTNASPEVSNPVEFDVVCSLRETQYLVYRSNSWLAVNYRGLVNSIENIAVPQQDDLINLVSSPKDYKIYNNGSWVDVNYKAMFLNETQVNASYAVEDNLIILTGSKYFVYINNIWTLITDSIYMIRKFVSDNQIIGE